MPNEILTPEARARVEQAAAELAREQEAVRERLRQAAGYSRMESSTAKRHTKELRINPGR